MGGGGSSGPTQSTVYQSSLPQYARPYYEHMLGSAEAEVNQPYVQYTGPRVAASTPFMNAYYSGISSMGPAYPVLEGQDATRNALGLATAAANNPNAITSQYTPTSYTATGPNIRDVNSGMMGWNDWDSSQAARYMSPYQQYVTDMRKQSAQLDYARTRNKRNEAAFRANAFGGDRQGVMEALGEESLLNRMSQIDQEGLNNAYMNAQQQFAADRQAGMTGQQFNIDSWMKADLANQGMDAQRYQLGEQARQFGAQFGDQSQQYYNNSMMDALLKSQQNQQNWVNSMMGGGQQLGGLAELFQNLESQRLSQIGQAGQLQQSQAQVALDQAYQDFVNQRDYQRNNISFISSILHGLPTGVNSQSDTIAYQNPMNAAIGAGIQGIGLQKSMGGG